jgi:hypothetical protein
MNMTDIEKGIIADIRQFKWAGDTVTDEELVIILRRGRERLRPGQSQDMTFDQLKEYIFKKGMN